ncbi:glycoside hydrolase [Haloferula rosea]|uniref:RICIN domain-containing protein n=1 Tax=Haloferula rosea TaxID=490093 RepID=A0A934RF90_9BACT|nr:glycoside hydrolase [Haloferula rosea]MBK1827310.1 RICIN domain-containing protein [Haloferula rosea]
MAVEIPASAVSPGQTSYTTADGGVTLGSSSPFTQSSNYFGIEGGTNALAIDDADGLAPADEVLTIQLQPGFHATGLRLRWARGLISISGLAGDPEAGLGDYDAETGTWTYYQAWTSSSSVSYTFANRDATLGRSLSLTVLDPVVSNPQFSLVSISYENLNDEGSPVPIFIDGSNRQQVMESFGASGYWSFDPTESWPEELKERMAEYLFSEAGGIGLSSFRFDFGGGDLDENGNRITGLQTSEPGSWRFPEALKTSAEGDYDWSRRMGQQWFLRRAHEYGIRQLTLGSNSPPAWATKNGRTFCDESVVAIGNTNLDPAMRDEYAAYLCDVIEHFRDQDGIVFSEVSPLNEPEYLWDNGSQEGCRYFDLVEIRELVNALHSEMSGRDLVDGTRILLGDHASIRSVNNRNYLSELYGHPDTAGKLAPVVGYHSYFTDLDPDLDSSLRDDLRSDAAELGMATMMTEFCPLRQYGNGRDLSIEPAWYVFKVIHRDLTRANNTAWSWWRALSPADYKDGLLYTDFRAVGSPDPEVFDSKLLWMLGNFSRFIRPGATRLGVQAPDELSGLMVSAWLGPDEREVVVVAGNASTEPQEIRLSPSLSGAAGDVLEWQPWLTDAGHSLERGAAFTEVYEMPPRSFVTFVGRRTTSPFRLHAVVTADDAYYDPSVTPQVSLSARATWEDGVVTLRSMETGGALSLGEQSEWVLRPVEREPLGMITESRYEVCAATSGRRLGLGGDESMLQRPLALVDEAIAWDLERDLQGRLRLRHVSSQRVLGLSPAGEWVGVIDGGEARERVNLEAVPVAAEFEWADGFGDGPVIHDDPVVPRWYQVRARFEGSVATGRLLVRPGESASVIAGVPDQVEVLKGQSVSLSADRREGGGTVRFRINAAHADVTLLDDGGDGPELPVLSEAPKGGDDELWEWIDPLTGESRVTLENGDQGRLRNVQSGRFLWPQGGSSGADAPVVQAPLLESGPATLWEISEVESGRWRIQHVVSGHVLSISGTTGLPVTWPDGPELNLRFYLDVADARPSQRWWSGGFGSARTIDVTPQQSGRISVHETTAGLLTTASVDVRVLQRYSDWAEQWFVDPELADTGSSADFDGDGLSNEFEYIHGLNPRDGVIETRPVTVDDIGAGQVEVVFLRNPDAAGQWQLETSPDCNEWRVMDTAEYEERDRSFRVVANRDGRGFYRLRFIEVDS